MLATISSRSDSRSQILLGSRLGIENTTLKKNEPPDQVSSGILLGSVEPWPG